MIEGMSIVLRDLQTKNNLLQGRRFHVGAGGPRFYLDQATSRLTTYAYAGRSANFSYSANE